MLRDHLIHDEERLRIASRAPVDVYVPGPDDTQYVSDYTGNYWPFRALGYDEATTNKNATERTIDRTLSLRLYEDRRPGFQFPGCLSEFATSVGADSIQPSISTGLSRDAIAHGCDLFNSHDSPAVTLLVPVTEPYALVLSCVNQMLCNPGDPLADRLAAADRPHPTDIALTDPFALDLTLSELTSLLEELRAITSNDMNIHLHDVYPTVELAGVLREAPNLVSSVTLAPPAVDAVEAEAADSSHGLSGVGQTDLRCSLAPGVQLAGAFSLLTSDYLSDSAITTLVEETMLPSMARDTPLRSGYCASIGVPARDTSKNTQRTGQSTFSDISLVGGS
jgi:hypothetical protein